MYFWCLVISGVDRVAYCASAADISYNDDIQRRIVWHRVGLIF